MVQCSDITTTDSRHTRAVLVYVIIPRGIGLLSTRHFRIPAHPAGLHNTVHCVHTVDRNRSYHIGMFMFDVLLR